MTLASNATWLCGCWFGLRGFGTTFSSGTSSSKAQLTAGPEGFSRSAAGAGSGTDARFFGFRSFMREVRADALPPAHPRGGKDSFGGRPRTFAGLPRLRSAGPRAASRSKRRQAASGCVDSLSLTERRTFEARHSGRSQAAAGAGMSGRASCLLFLCGTFEVTPVPRVALGSIAEADEAARLAGEARQGRRLDPATSGEVA